MISLLSKCQNLVTVFSSNIYVHIEDINHEYRSIETPDFLESFILNTVHDIEDYKALKSINVNNHVYELTDPFQFTYISWPKIEIRDKIYTITIGPMIKKHLTAEEIKYLGYKMKLSSENNFILESFYKIVPYYTQDQIENIVSLFSDYFFASPKDMIIKTIDYDIEISSSKPNHSNKFASYDFIEANYDREELFLKTIELGDVERIKELFKSTQASFTLPTRYPSDPLREVKNFAITLNSISVRAAIKGGLSRSIAHNMSYHYAILIEEQFTVDAITKLQRDMAVDYASSVKKYGLKNLSSSVKEAIIYIRQHLTDKISVTDIASHLHLSREHLSRLFKEEMDLTLSDYIHQLKIDESLPLLSSKVYSVNEIAYMFAYSSPAHYTKAFKKIKGLSPKKWQSDQNNKD
ncbi:AraC family transcriptional regulator [Acidaminobacter sp. JC074]|uniref:AraC family transcriptional regulator n=1 Tax=Acidaminobacter sp. JC074 TaxID=2530199 RepID=UPI001F110755|nr:AraC family transcriptional regulator [Acidaminobacter sp. JC074]MCH4886450.1 AraC family transcriptional regulator [Acidaminobacter sp. JC074]